MNKFETVEMASGGLALVLEPSAEWGDFSKHSTSWAKKLKANVLKDPVISIDECLQEVEIEGQRFWITYDDFQSSIQLEPSEKSFNGIILAIQKILKSSG
ncbi:MAG: hypothetical protein EOO52_06985 [Gammaproteobacteria bacterium]|nr:MAG: hypothetical protein EOO52_06985 [Gammaproteobacteria bacterium]